MNSHIDGRLWGGRFCIENDSLMKIFNDSVSIDKRLWRQDINGSKEWVKAIRSAELVSDNEMNKILQGLNQIYEEWNNKKFILKENDEDIHTANERRLKEIIGDCAMKLHTGRSRNDQVACDIRLWLNENLTEMETNLKNLILSLTKRADEQIEILMPGYTHMQRAQAIRWSQLLLSYATALDRDFDRLIQFKERNNVCPLGSGAIAGNPFDINRELLAMNLNFKHASFNSIDSTANRDFICIIFKLEYFNIIICFI
jgi:argininosuccinate lyase